MKPRKVELKTPTCFGQMERKRLQVSQHCSALSGTSGETNLEPKSPRTISQFRTMAVIVGKGTSKVANSKLSQCCLKKIKNKIKNEKRFSTDLQNACIVYTNMKDFDYASQLHMQFYVIACCTVVQSVQIYIGIGTGGFGDKCPGSLLILKGANIFLGPAIVQTVVKHPAF